MGIAGRDLAILSARAGVMRAGASRAGFWPNDVEGVGHSEPGEYIWKEHKPPTTTWTLQGVGNCICPTANVASFTATPTSGSYPLSVAFTDTSTEAITFWYWEFGDGSTSSAQNPTHIYAHPGTYTVSLWVSGPGGAAGPATATIVVIIPGTIAGTVYAADGITPMPGETVNLSGAAIDSIVTNGAGLYTFANLAAGDYVVECNGATNSGTLTSGATLVLDIVLNPI